MIEPGARVRIGRGFYAGAEALVEGLKEGGILAQLLVFLPPYIAAGSVYRSRTVRCVTNTRDLEPNEL